MFTHLNLTQDLKIIRFGGDYQPLPEAFADLEVLIKENENLYPGIDKWYDRKIISGLKCKERRAYVIYNEDKPIGASIIRLGSDTKICSVRLTKDKQKKGLGYLIFILLANEIRHVAKKVHFTLPESLWLNKNVFFDNFGFKKFGLAHNQYRLFEQEFACGTDFAILWKNAIKNLPKTLENFTINGNSNNCDIVLSIKPEFANKIIRGQKNIEIRRKFSKKWIGAKALIYASSPLKHFVGEAVISEIHQSEPRKIWNTWKNEIGCSWGEYSSYCKGADKIYAILFSDVNRFKCSIPEIQVETLINKEINPPQSYCEVKKESVWPTAVALNCLLRTHL